MEDEDEPASPFWLSNSNKKTRKPINNLLQRSSSFLLNSFVFIILLLALAFLFIFIITPMIRNATSQIFKPRSLIVKRSWDYVNLVLVLFAIVCAFLSRNNDDENQNQHQNQSFGEDSGNGVASGSLRSRNQWYGNGDRSFNNRSFNRMKSSNSYPDIREESLLVVSGDDHRFYDDTHLIDHRFINEDKIAHHRRQQSLPELRSDLSPPQEKIVVKRNTKRVRPDLVIQENPEEIKSAVHDATLYPPSAALVQPLVGDSPPSLPQSTTGKRRAERTRGARANEEKLKRPVKSKREPNVKSRTPPPPPPPPPSPPPEKKIGKGDRKRSGSNSNSTKDLFGLLYQQKREKKQRQKSVENFDAILHPPEPPPPPAVTKPKTTKHKSSSSSLTTKASRVNTFDHDINNLSSGNDSPLRIPPPPPPPPFRMKSRKFAVIGDYVRINSIGSSSSDSPDFDHYDRPSTSNLSSYATTDEMDGGDSPPLRSPVSCPSPDVDSKADKFIARIRAGLKLEKVSSINERQGIGLSKLGPDPSPNPSPDLNPSHIS